MNETVNIICMKWGNKYGPEYVNKLYLMVKRSISLPFRFVCFTDNSESIIPEVEIMPLPDIYVPEHYDISPWRKLSMLGATLGDLQGKALFLDLDIIIIENIDCFFDYADKFSIIENWTQVGQNIGNSSVYCFQIGKYKKVLEHYTNNTEQVLKSYDNEQIFLSHKIWDIKFWPKEWCVSFKRHCMLNGPLGLLNWFITPKIPKGAKIIVFHGNPKPEDAAIGKYPGKIFKHVKPTKWIEKYWS